jgi:hypothetical protein
MDFAFDRSRDLSRQVRNALEDETAQPLREVQRHAPEGCDYFSELEASLGEWSFGYGVAWALARAGDPMMSSSAAARIAEAAVAEAWSLFSSNQRWTALMAADRAERGPVDAEVAPEARDGEASDLGQFMEKVARSRTRRFSEQRGTGTDG